MVLHSAVTLNTVVYHAFVLSLAALVHSAGNVLIYMILRHMRRIDDYTLMLAVQ